MGGHGGKIVEGWEVKVMGSCCLNTKEPMDVELCWTGLLT